MDKRILERVNDFAQWHGNPFALAALVADLQREIDREKLVAAEMTEAAELL